MAHTPVQAVTAETVGKRPKSLASSHATGSTTPLLFAQLVCGCDTFTPNNFSAHENANGTDEPSPRAGVMRHFDTRHPDGRRPGSTGIAVGRSNVTSLRHGRRSGRVDRRMLTALTCARAIDARVRRRARDSVVHRFHVTQLGHGKPYLRPSCPGCGTIAQRSRHRKNTDITIRD